MRLPFGSSIPERMLLELTLVGSANNAARSLARHVFGDEAAFLEAARAWLEDAGLTTISVVDASGMSDENRGGLRGVLALAQLAFDDPVVGEILAEEVTFTPPTVDSEPRLVPSTHGLIGEFGIVAAKSGHTDAAGYNVAFRCDAGGAPVVGVILGAPSMAQRDLDAGRLISGIAR